MLRGDARAQLDQLVVEERHADLERAGHRRAVEVGEHVVDQRRAVRPGRGRPRAARRRGRRPACRGQRARRRRRARPARRRTARRAGRRGRSRWRRAGGWPGRRPGAPSASRPARPGPWRSSAAAGPRRAPGTAAPALGQRGDAVLAVAAEELVGALAGERDGDVRRRASSQSARKPIEERSASGSSRCQISRRRYVGVALELDLELVVVGAQRVGHAARVGELGVLAGEADRERLERLGHVARHQRDDQARVQAAAEHRAERHVAHQAQPHRLVELVEHDLGPLVGRARVALGVRHRVVPPALEPAARRPRRPGARPAAACGRRAAASWRPGT